MIANVTSDPNILVTTGISNSFYNTTVSTTGEVRYNSQTHKLEAYNGSSWANIQESSVYISLTPVAKEAIEWAQRKMAEEIAAERKAISHPAVKAALDNLKAAEEKLKLTMILSNNESNTTS